MSALLRVSPEGCRDCPLGWRRFPRSAGHGPLSAEVAVVGLNPSERARGLVSGAFLIPFLARQQRAGRLEALKLSGAERAFAALAAGVPLDLSSVYSTNAVKCATPGNRRPIRPEVLACAERYLRRELEDLPNLRAVLVFGKVAGDALGLSDFGQTVTVEGTIAQGRLFRHPVATLRRWTRLNLERTNIREFLRSFAPSSMTGDSAPAPP